MDLPQEFKDRMKQMLGSEYPDFMDSYTQPRRRGLRVNTLKILPKQLEKAVPFHLQPVPWIDGAYTYEEEDAVSRHPFYYAGLYYLQEPSAMTPADVLDVQPGMQVLDLCAAPGGKATALGAKLKGEGLLTANDISAARCRALLRNIELAGIGNAFVTNAPGQTLGEHFPGFFDRILLDAPCSGEGMFRKDESTIRAWDPEKPARCAAVQKELILQAAEMLRPGGKLLYSTCTFSRTEDEDVIAFALEKRPDLELCSIPMREGFAGGLPGFEKCVRLWPHRIGGEGHFLALLQKKGGPVEQDLPLQKGGPAEQELSPAEEKKRSKGKSGGQKRRRGSAGDLRNEDGQIRLLTKFLEDHALRTDPARTEIRKGQAYQSAVPSGMVSGVAFVRNGLYLGECKKDRFEPSQSLALSSAQFPGPGVPPADPALLSFDPEDPRLAAFLRGEPVDLSGQEASQGGWRLVAAAGYPLGWGKCTGMQLKNKLPASWRSV